MARKKKIVSLRCPTCRKIVLANAPDFPFCSDRCRTIDLGKWISGGYVISTPIDDPESGGEAEYNAPQAQRLGSRLTHPVQENTGFERKPN